MVAEGAAGGFHVGRVLRLVGGLLRGRHVLLGNDVVNGLHLLLIFISATDVLISTHDQS